ncbi:NUDIX hydrolase [Paenibacillus sp. GCM10023248]|uniref:NUDIX hydrolase n=1 Tax=Bacillales TaxID=1385 RepID=UPI0023780C25|nr:MULTISPECIES: NUDIX domain-containing protein [Bacillales]MDD9271735.1 NUDIX domain-containing protein [Paenibacillus sp. MAHUQ-63]MDR6884615.1 8-oxo-dGTP pyrophosphatase MutT (NUDIX family) [Bacillus sp. 3255]
MKFIVSASVIVLNENNEILLMRGRRGWEMPQGCVEEGETIREAAVREVKEETGIEVELINFCGLYQNITRGVCNNIFTGKPVDGSLTTSIESDEVGYFSLEEARKMITWGNFMDRVDMALNNQTHPFLVEFRES